MRDFRSYAALELDLRPGLVLVTGANGVGKTNLLEAVHVGSQGFSPRTRAEQQLVRFGAAAASVALEGEETAAPACTHVVVRPAAPKLVRLNGAALASSEELRGRLTALAFLPERLAVVKGGPLVRRLYLDRMLGRLAPARAELPSQYARALAQRNEALRRARAAPSSRPAIAPWTAQVATLGTELDRNRAELARLLAPGFAEAAEELGLRNALLVYDERELTVELLDRRLDRDVERGTTGAGPHLRDAGILAGDRDLRSFGSQGEQRTAVLALVLAEAGILAERRGTQPLLLLDDVLSELDGDRRSALIRLLPAGAQTLVTATSSDALPPDAPDPALEVAVAPGEARAL